RDADGLGGKVGSLAALPPDSKGNGLVSGPPLLPLAPATGASPGGSAATSASSRHRQELVLSNTSSVAVRVTLGYTRGGKDLEVGKMQSTVATHIRLDDRGVAWIDDTNTKVIEV